jgi:hypothetical protein
MSSSSVESTVSDSVLTPNKDKFNSTHLFSHFNYSSVMDLGTEEADCSLPDDFLLSLSSTVSSAKNLE